MYTVYATHKAQKLTLKYHKDTATEALRTASHLCETGWECRIEGPRRFVVRELPPR